MDKYIFKSNRLGFRNWEEEDVPALAEINNDAEVMEFFPGRPSAKDSLHFIKRMQVLYSQKGYCYFAVDKLNNQEFIGFIGLAEQDFKADFTPCIDIGWRLKRSAWYKGYATEGATACLNFAFQHLNLEKVMAIAPVVNKKSVSVMQKIGMQKVKTFPHPKLLGYASLQDCVLYEITKAAQNKVIP